MRRETPIRKCFRFGYVGRCALALLGCLLFLKPAAGQVVDRIIARIEGDILTLSELRELGQMQLLFSGKTEDDEVLFNRLVDEWIISTELEAAHFPRPLPGELQQALSELEKKFPSPEAFRQRLKDLGLTEADVTRMLEQQIRSLRYADYKFRATAQPAREDEQRYFEQELAPKLRQRGEQLPEFDDVEEQIREVLVQKQIAARTGRWLDETRGRLKIERIGETKIR